ncbi:ParA family protein [Vibrio cortegadensis]|uniref:ParA family protein n=1 Tax=Vibrio cortegadensis TaxID=1328770 RepID=A0ABV4MC03_9VIBR
MNKSTDTLELINDIATGASKMLNVRSEQKPKLIRTFSRPEAVSYLRTDYRTIEKHAAALGFDWKEYKEFGIDWQLDLDQIYAVRDALPESTTLKKTTEKFELNNGKRTQVIVCQNQKGGTGKTMVSVTMATGLAVELHEQYRVLLIDLDGQATATSFQPSEYQVTAGDLLKLDPSSEGYEQRCLDAVADTSIPNLKILPAAQRDRDLEAAFHNGIMAGEYNKPYEHLKSVLQVVGDQFDIVIIDTAPALSFATLNAYFAATSVIMPLSANHNDTDATFQFLSYLPSLYKTLMGHGHQGYDFFKFLLTNHELTSTTSEIRTELETNFAGLVFSKEFKKSEAVRKCALEKNTVFDVSGSSYTGTKKTLTSAKENAKEVLGTLHGQLLSVWKQQERENEQA